MNQNDFIKTTLPFERNLFNELSTNINFESTGKGRLGNHLIKASDKGIPLVRTTTQFNIPAHNFCSVHNTIVDTVNDHRESLPFMNFNNALIEIYDSSYTKMKYHSDQSLDLAPNSYIGLFSCYEKPNELTEQSLRKLKIKDKTTNKEFEILLTHNSFVLFSTSVNSRFSHKIVLEQVPKQKPLQSENKWLGITFRESKTFINFKNNSPYLINGKILELATEEQAKRYYKLRGEENRNIDFIYPNIEYTLSKADTTIPIGI